jgi:DUF4097 and DUF4098 domain-containing protein YvlB
MEMTMKTATRLFLLLALASAPAWAHRHSGSHEGGRPIDEHRPLKPDAHVTVNNVSGRIEVEAWDKNEMQLTGELGDDVDKLEITGTESSLKIEVKLPHDARNADADTVLVLKLPAGVALEAEAVSADVSVRGLRGPLSVESVSGDVRIDVQSARLKAASVSGDVRVDAPSADTKVNSVSGDLTVRGVRGEFKGETVSGDIHLEGHDLKALDLKTVSGDAELSLGLAKDARVEVETLSGELSLSLPALPEGELEMETFSGEISAAWPLDYDDDHKEVHRRGKGDGRMRLHSFSGDIRLRQR